MGTWATGKYALRISDRSGMAFPYREMVQEWNGFWVHTSEFESKQPQLLTYYHQADAQSLQYPKPQKKSGIVVELGAQYWPGQFLSKQNVGGPISPTTGLEQTTYSMMPDPISPTDVWNSRRLLTAVGKLTVSTT